MYLLRANIFLLAILPVITEAVRVYTNTGIVDVADIVDTSIPLEVLRKRRMVMVDKPLFDPRNQQHSPHIFSAITSAEAFEAFSRYILGTASFSPIPDKEYSNAKVKDKLKAINSQDVGMCQHLYCCKFLERFIYGLSKDSLKTITPLCTLVIVSSAARDDPGLEIPKIFPRFPDTILTTHGAVITMTLGKRIVEMDLTSLQKVLKVPAACGAITDSGWAEIISSGPVAQLVNAECVKKGHKSIVRIMNRPGLKTYKLGSEAFSLVNLKLSGILLHHTSEKQLEGYAKYYEMGQFPGKNLKLSEIPSKSAAGLSLRLILGHLYSKLRDNPVLSMSSAAWRRVPEDIFSKLSEDDVALMRVALQSDMVNNIKSVQEHLKVRQLEDLLQHPELCSIIEPVSASKKVKLTKSCFRSMPANSQATAIAVGGDLPDDAFESVTANEVKNWGYGEHTGLAVLGLASRRSNFGKLISNLGRKASFDHPCQLITGVDELKQLMFMQINMSANCFANLGFELQKEDYAGLKARLGFLVPYAQMKRTRPKEFWIEMSPEDLKMIISGGQFCSQIDQEIMILVNRRALQPSTGHAISNLEW